MADFVVVEGAFHGVGEDGSARSVAFADLWRFKDGRATSRASYLAMGQDYVTR